MSTYSANCTSNEHIAAKMMSMVNKPVLRPLSTATSIAADSDNEETPKAPRRSQLVWQSRKGAAPLRTMDEDVQEAEDTESLTSLSSRAKFMNDLLSDTDSSIAQSSRRESFEMNTTMTTISSDGPHTPRSPAPEYVEEYVQIGYPDEKARPLSYEGPNGYASKEMSMKTAGPHLFRSFSTTHSPRVPFINVAQDIGHDVPPTPALTNGTRSPSPTGTRKGHPAAGQLTPQLSPPSDSEPMVLGQSEEEETVYTLDEIREWTTEDVCQWLARGYFDRDIINKFEQNDISGALLIDLKFADTKELGITSWGKRIQVWTAISRLRNPFDKGPQTADSAYVRPGSLLSRQDSTVGRGRSGSIGSAASTTPRSLPSPNLRRNQSPRESVISEGDEIQTEASSIRERSTTRPRPQLRKKARKTSVRIPRRQISVDSIIITSDNEDGFTAALSHEYVPLPLRARSTSRQSREQSEPRKHRCKHSHKHSRGSHGSHGHKRCTKGDRCRKHGKVAALNLENAASRLSNGEHGTILIATTPSLIDPANPPRISALYSEYGLPPNSPFPPHSPAGYSAVASSDVLGPNLRDLSLKESNLQDIERIDPLETVHKFLSAQDLPSPTTPPFRESYAPPPPPVPAKTPPTSPYGNRYSPPPVRSTTAPPPVPTIPEFAVPPPSAPPASYGIFPRQQYAYDPRTTTPFSEADVPVPCTTPLQLRQYSNSVPPDLASRRTPNIESLRHRPTPLDRVPEHRASTDSASLKMAPSPSMRTHSGWMKKRTGKWFRHEWPDYHFVLRGTQLGYAKDVGMPEVGSFDVDEYNVAVTNAGSGKKLAAKMKIFGSKKKDDAEESEAARKGGEYVFQLVPAGDKKAKSKVMAKGREYLSAGTKEERLEWVRNIMLAKTVAAKREGWEVEVNGERM